MSKISFLAPGAGADRCCREVRSTALRQASLRAPLRALAPIASLRAASPSASIASLRIASPRGGHRGFSLVELIIVVALAAILVAIGYPSYINYKIRANRAAAQSLLIDLANRQQLHFLDARAFTTNLAKLGANPLPPDVAPYYVIPDPIIDNAATPPAFTLSALARAGTIQAKDGDLSINSSGMRAGHW